MVSGTMRLSRATLFAGSGAIAAQRGLDIWGANWLFHKYGAQNDIMVIGEEFKNLSTSGAYATDAELRAASGVLRTNSATISGILNTRISASGDAIIRDLSTHLWNASGVLRTNTTNVSGALNTKINASGDAIIRDLSTHLWNASGVLRTNSTNISGAIMTQVNTNLWNASGVLRTNTTNVSGAITTRGSFTFPTILSGIINQELRPNTSGTMVLGNSSYPFSGIYVRGTDNLVYKFVVTKDLLLSGVVL